MFISAMAFCVCSNLSKFRSNTRALFHVVKHLQSGVCIIYRKGSDANKGEVLLVEIWKRDRVEFPSWSLCICPLITV